jgi:hypothetical protein
MRAAELRVAEKKHGGKETWRKRKAEEEEHGGEFI